MESQDELIKSDGDYAFAKPGEIYVFYVKKEPQKLTFPQPKAK